MCQHQAREFKHWQVEQHKHEFHNHVLVGVPENDFVYKQHTTSDIEQLFLKMVSILSFGIRHFYLKLIYFQMWSPIIVYQYKGISRRRGFQIFLFYARGVKFWQQLSCIQDMNSKSQTIRLPQLIENQMLQIWAV